MGVSLGGRYGRVRVSKRGVGVSAGPRVARVHVNRNGSTGFSSGVGPATYSTPLTGGARRNSSGSDRTTAAGYQGQQPPNLSSNQQAVYGRPAEKKSASPLWLLVLVVSIAALVLMNRSEVEDESAVDDPPTQVSEVSSAPLDSKFSDAAFVDLVSTFDWVEANDFRADCWSRIDPRVTLDTPRIEACLGLEVSMADVATEMTISFSGLGTPPAHLESLVTETVDALEDVGNSQVEQSCGATGGTYSSSPCLYALADASVGYAELVKLMENDWFFATTR